MRSSALFAPLLAIACLASSPARADEIRVAVAANFFNALEALVQQFEAISEHTVRVSSGSTGSHYAQIRNGAPFDAFFAADVRRPAMLESEGIAIAGSRFTYAVGRLALWSRDPGRVDGDGRVLAGDDFRFLAIANPDLAPYGAAARQVLERRGLWDALRPRIVLGQDIGQTYGFVYSRNAELGFVAYSQLQRPGSATDGSWWVVPDGLYAPIEQQAVLLNDVAGAREFLDFVGSDAARSLIVSFGYGL